jgi:hypothetical protein
MSVNVSSFLYGIQKNRIKAVAISASDFFVIYFSLGYGQAIMPPSITLTFFQPFPSSASAAS